MGTGVWRAAVLGAVSAVGVGAAIAMTAPGADAKSAYESPYGYDRTWNAALRFVRVDNGWKVTEKDDQSGYLLFEYTSPESAKATPGSLELVRGPGRGATVNVLAQLPQMPRYHEQVLLDSLAAKMRREYGDPPSRRSPEEGLPDAGDAGAE
jgi:hypothetical protein